MKNEEWRMTSEFLCNGVSNQSEQSQTEATIQNCQVDPKAKDQSNINYPSNNSNKKCLTP